MVFSGVVNFVLISLLGIARQWSRKKIVILTLKPRSHVRILIHRRTWAIKLYSIVLLVEKGNLADYLEKTTAQE